MNKVYLIGNLTRDPEQTTTSNGVSVCHLSIAVPRGFTSADGERGTDFFNITAWRGLADNCAKFLKKGNKVAVAGSIQIRNYERADGSRGTAVDVMANEVEFLSSKNDSSSESGVPSAPAGSGAPVSDLQPIDDDLPF